MLFNMNMFDSNLPLAANRSVGYESVLKHRHSFVEMVYVENGEGTQKLDTGEKMTVKKGDVFIIADDTQHSIRPTCAETEFQIINILFEKDQIDVDYSLFKNIQTKNFPTHHPIVRYIHNCLEAYESKSGEYVLRMKGWIYLILAEYLNNEASGRKEVQKRSGAEEYVRKATRYIHENYPSKLTLETVAASVGVTSGYLQKLFREYCNTSVIEYLLRYRMESACKMLAETEHSVQDISVMVGYSDVKNFHYRFKRIFGITPLQYRLSHKLDSTKNQEQNEEVENGER